jgi:hypothetical protein
MASKNVCCPVPTAVASAVTTLNPCPTDIGQIQKLVFWRAGNSIASEATALISSTWTTLLAATGSTKAIVTPFLGNPTFEGGEPREFGGGNETRDGIPHRKGEEPMQFTAAIQQAAQSVVKTMKDWSCENLEVMFIGEGNQLFYRLDGSAVEGFPIRSLFVSSLMPGGFTDDDANQISFYLPPNWSDDGTLSAASTFLLDMVNS